MIKESFIDEFLMKEDELTDDFKEKAETLDLSEEKYLMILKYQEMS